MLRGVIASGTFPGVGLKTQIIEICKVPVDQLGLKELEVHPEGVDHDVSHFEIMVND